MTSSEKHKPQNLDSEIRILEHKQLKWETSRVKRGLNILTGIIAIIGGVGGFFYGQKEKEEKEKALADKNEVLREKLTSLKEAKRQQDIVQQTLDQKIIDLKQEYEQKIIALKHEHGQERLALKLSNLNPIVLPNGIPGPWSSNMGDLKTKLVEEKNTELERQVEALKAKIALQPSGDTDPPKIDPVLQELASQLFDENGSIRVRAYDTITSKPRRYDADLPRVIIKEASKHPENDRGIRNVIVSLRDMSRTTTRDRPLNKAAIEEFITHVDRQYADKPAIIKSLRSMEDWVLKSKR